MPLIVTLVFFGILFSLEACGEIANKAYSRRAVLRYERIEHPQRRGSDAYLDSLC